MLKPKTLALVAIARADKARDKNSRHWRAFEILSRRQNTNLPRTLLGRADRRASS